MSKPVGTHGDVVNGPAAASPFPSGDLEANRQGRLTDAQRKGWSGAERDWSGTVSLMALVLAVAGVLLLTGAGQTPLPTYARLLAGAGCLAGAGVLAYVSVLGGGQLARDLREGRVEVVEGAILKSRQQVNAGAQPGFHYLEVAGRKLRCGLEAYDAAPDAGIVRVYYLPRSRKVVNLERLADRPLPAGALDDPSVLARQAAQAIGSHDRTQRAEAMATLAAMEAAMTGPATPPPAGQRDARPLAEAIVGAWHGPALNVTFSPDGTATGTVASGTSLTGRWSVGGDGKLRLDGMGQDMVADAWVAGDALTLEMGGERMSLRRVGTPGAPA
jgi:hypothetical protein